MTAPTFPTSAAAKAAGWFSRRHRTSAPHLAAQAAVEGEASQEARRVMTTDTEYVWTCVRTPRAWYQCDESNPHPECRWVLQTVPVPGGGRWDGTGAPAPLNRDPGAALEVTL